MEEPFLHVPNVSASKTPRGLLQIITPKPQLQERTDSQWSDFSDFTPPELPSPMDGDSVVIDVHQNNHWLFSNQSQEPPAKKYSLGEQIKPGQKFFSEAALQGRYTFDRYLGHGRFHFLNVICFGIILSVMATYAKLKGYLMVYVLH